MKHYDDVDAFLACATSWRGECEALRAILLDCGLEESIRWGKPCYSHEDDKIVLLQPMKNFLAAMFFKGALIEDPAELLEEQGENTRSARRVCFTSVAQVKKLDKAMRGLVRKAIAVEKQGLTLPERPKLVLAEELQARLDSDAALKNAFAKLTPGRQREYNLHVCGAKQSATRARRVEQHIPRILAGKGLRDR